MKKFLSMVLALVMAMSLVTVSAGAKDFNDSDKISDIAYEEAVNVMSEMGIIDGYGDGNFQPQGTLTRGAAAKIIACMMLGKTTAEALGTQAAPFKDVPVGSTFAGYIAYCVESGIIDGYSDGTFRPGNTLTGFAFLKMLLTALGYDSAIEGYANNANWTVNVAGRAKQVGLLDGNDEFVGTRAATREEACLYAVNALQATLVEYTDKGGSISVGDITINTGASNATYVTSNVYDAATSINDTTDNVKNGWTVEFAEKYQPDLALKDTTDAFGRPAHTWTWKKAEIGTYVEYDKMVGEFTEKVTGRDLVDLLTKATIDDNTVYVYVDGETDKAVLGDAFFTAGNMIKTNTEKVGATGDGVLTQVFLDTVEDEITVAIINTYLAQADEDYNEKTEDLDLTVYKIDNKGTKAAPVYVKDSDKETMTVEVEDFDIEDVSEDDLFLVTVAEGVIQTMEAPEILSEASVDSFKLGSYVTADGTQYDYASTAMYDEEVLDQYDNKNMKDVTYNVILDPYGYLIGIELNEDPDQYVFLTGIDLGSSNLAAKNADANVIFLDGKMDTVTVNMKDSEFAAGTIDNAGHNAQLNTWCTYTVSDSGIYTLEEVALTTDKDAKPAVKVAQHAQDVTAGNTVTINQKNVSLDGTPGDFTKVYGNDDTVYLNVELGENIEDRGGALKRIIDDVESVSVGVKNVDIDVTNVVNDGLYAAPAAEIYTLYNKDGYIIAAVTIGENNGISSSYAYITSSSVNKEALTDGKWAWTREAVVDGKLVELKEVGTNLKILDELKEGVWYEIKYDADGNVRKVDSSNITGINNYTGIPFAAGTKFVPEVANVQAAVNNFDTVLLFDNGNRDATTGTADDITALTYKNGTLYTNTDATKGFSVSPDVKVVLALADKDGDPFDDVDDSYTGYAGLEKALKDMNANHEGFTAGRIELSAILKSGAATVIIINDKTPDGSVDIGDSTVTFEYKPVITQNGTFLNIQANTADGDGSIVYVSTFNWLVEKGYTVVRAQKVANGGGKADYWTFYVSKDGQNTFFDTVLTPMVKININGDTKFYAEGTVISSTTASDTTLVSGGDYWWYSKNASPAFDHTDNSDASTAGGDVQAVNENNYKVSYSAHNGKLTMITGLYKVTVAAGPRYYKAGDTVALAGNWYGLTAAPAAGDVYAVAGGLKMTAAMNNKTVHDGYYKVTVVDPTNGQTVQYKKAGKTDAFGDLTAKSYAYDTQNGKYVEVDADKKLTVSSSDITVTNADDVFYKVYGTANVTGTLTNLNGMILTANVSGGDQYIKAGGSVTLNLALTANGATASGNVSAKLSSDAATVTSTPNITSGATKIITSGAAAFDATHGSYTVTITAPTAADIALKVTLS